MRQQDLTIRNHVYMFLGFPFHTRLEIAQKLSLVDWQNQSDLDFHKMVFSNAREKNKQEELFRLIREEELKRGTDSQWHQQLSAQWPHPTMNEPAPVATGTEWDNVAGTEDMS